MPYQLVLVEEAFRDFPRLSIECVYATWESK